MKELCFGIMLGTILGVLAANNDKLAKVAVKGADIAEKKAKDIKEKIAKKASE